MNVISLGAGVQSSTMALMAAHGEITPMPAAAIFADVGAEPNEVYFWLKYLCGAELYERAPGRMGVRPGIYTSGVLPFPTHVVAVGNLRDDQLAMTESADGFKYSRNLVPAYVMSSTSTVPEGMLMRACTRDYKIRALKRCQRELAKEWGVKSVTSWIGISTDEAHRMKPSNVGYAINRWPLIEANISRGKCLEWMRAKGYAKPPKSACTFCPYHSDAQWLDLKTNSPDEFVEAVEFEVEWNHIKKLDARPNALKSEVVRLHRSLKPLDQVDFTSASDGQGDMFGDECEGMCGV